MKKAEIERRRIADKRRIGAEESKGVYAKG